MVNHHEQITSPTDIDIAWRSMKERAHSDVWTRVRVVVEWCDVQSSVCVCGLLDGVALRRTRDLVVGRSPFRSLMKSVRENRGNRP
jgi:hypothetical protein